jgi:glycosyltransferase involved in cell wall biosynthesis
MERSVSEMGGIVDDQGASRPLKIAIEARITPGIQGGVEQVAVGLAHGLSSLTDGKEIYYFITTDDSAWLEPYVGGNGRVVRTGSTAESQGLHRRVAARAPAVANVWGKFKRATIARNERAKPIVVPVSDGIVEGLGADVVHFTMQVAYLTDVPSMYHPHDLQHLHFPEFFSDEAIRWREANYRAFCEQATVVSVTTEWGKRDLVDHYALPAEKVAVIPLAPAIASYGSLEDAEAAQIVSDLGVIEPYAFYPAQTWPHKNHLRLVDAVYRARTTTGADVRLVCSGLQNEHFAAVQERVAELGLGDAITFVGFVEPKTVQSLYQRARLLVFPSLFEAAGGFGPVFEAFEIGVPVATSSATSLREQAGDAALVFDPTDVSDMAACLARLWNDEPLRTELVAKGRARVAQFTWDRVARTFRAHYRRIAGATLTPDDEAILSAPTPF